MQAESGCSNVHCIRPLGAGCCMGTSGGASPAHCCPQHPGGAGAVGGSCSGSWRLPRTLGPVQDQAGGSHCTALR